MIDPDASNGPDRAVLVIDDEFSIRMTLKTAARQRGFKVTEAGTLAEARDALDRGKYDLVFLDLRLPDGDGMRLLEELHSARNTPPVVVITAFDPEDTAVEAMKLGAIDYLGKPFELSDVYRLLDETSHAVRKQEPSAKGGRRDPGRMIGRSPAMLEIFKAIGRLARVDVPVLITGESGTGKEMVAREIHARSHRHGGPFVTVNTAAIPRELLENELFGHARGAFTGARVRHRGKFEMAGSGVLFLDELGEMPIDLQAKLLRAVQYKKIEPLGLEEEIEVDCRILAATNADVRQLIDGGRFREDLYYRMSVGLIRLPPLRERGADITVLAENILKWFGEEIKGEPFILAADAAGILHGYPWPGNVRELENVLKRAALTTASQTVGAREIAPQLETAQVLEKPPVRALEEAVRRFATPDKMVAGAGLLKQVTAAAERALIVETLRHTQGNQQEAARILGINRNTLRARIKQQNIGRYLDKEDDFQ